MSISREIGGPMEEERLAIAGRRETVHRVNADETIGTVRCNLVQTDEEWAPRVIPASEAVDKHRCGWCYPQRGG